MEAGGACNHQMEGIAEQWGQAVLDMACPRLEAFSGGDRLCRQSVSHAGAVAAARQSTRYTGTHNLEAACLWRGRRW